MLLLLLSIGCAPTIRRTGYTPEAEDATSAASSADCTVRITRNSNVPAGGTVIGTMKIGDSGFSYTCSEDKVLSILRTEACRIGADVIVLNDIRQPDLHSSCYRVTADFIRLEEGEQSSVEESTSTIEKRTLPDEEYYSDQAVDKRVRQRRGMQQCLGIMSGVLGLIVGLALFSPKF